MLKVLSVDWDFFMDCDATYRGLVFPDGGNESIGLFISNYIWRLRANDSKRMKALGTISKELSEIGILEQEYKTLKDMILNYKDEHVMLSDSHADIYRFIKNQMNKACCDKVSVYNVDFHSDTYNHGEELNCGNWVNKLDEENSLNSYTWVRRDEEENVKLKNTPVNILTSLEDIKDVEWDLIFICRSSIWSPPHLDKRFNELKQTFEEIGIGFTAEFFIDRDTV